MKATLARLTPFFLAFCVSAHALSGFSEPSFCIPENFYAREVKDSSLKASRLRAFSIGRLTLSGMAIGESDVEDVIAVAERYSDAGTREKYCTWYLNSGNWAAREAFNWHYVPQPNNDIPKMVSEYHDRLESSIDRDTVSWLSCVEEQGYLSIGCDGQKHRGPTGFAMFLSFAGCTPEHSVEIANKLWGLNGVPAATRLAIAQMAYDLGNERPDSRARMQVVLSKP